MWIPKKLSYICERMIAFSIPDDDAMWVMSYEGLHRVTIVPEISVETFPDHAEDYRIYDAKRRVLTFEGREYAMLGLHGGKPIHSHPSGDQLRCDFDDELIAIIGPRAEVKQVIEIKDLSGDWGAATFSPDGRYLVIGVPYDLYLFQQA